MMTALGIHFMRLLAWLPLPGKRISMVSVAADWGIDSVDTGSKANMVQNWAFRGDILWNHKITA